MRYFTREWFESGSPNAEERFAQYRAYLSTIQASVPVAVTELEAEHTLHDARVKAIRSNLDKRELEVALCGWDLELQHPVRYALKFTGVEEFEQVFQQKKRIDSELGDLAYWEYTALERQSEICMLFVSGAELRIRFLGFGFSHERAA